LLQDHYMKFSLCEQTISNYGKLKHGFYSKNHYLAHTRAVCQNSQRFESYARGNIRQSRSNYELRFLEFRFLWINLPSQQGGLNKLIKIYFNVCELEVSPIVVKLFSEWFSILLHS
jgi:hypothetical protein